MKIWLKKNWFQLIQTLGIITAFCFSLLANNIADKNLSLTYQFLPLQTSNVILKEAGVSISPEDDRDVIRSGITNIGRVRAENVCYSVYQVFFEDAPARRLWYDCFVNDLQPDDTATFGVLLAEYAATAQIASTTVQFDLRGMESALIFHVGYQDSITKEEKDGFFFFQHVVGYSSVNTLLRDQYGRIYDRLIKVAQEYEDNRMIEKIPSY